MKQRILTGCVIAVFFVLMMLCLHTPVFALLLALLTVISVYEIHKAAKIKNIPVTILSLVVSALTPISYIGYETTGTLSQILLFFRENAVILYCFYILIALILMLARFQATRFEHVAISVFSAIAVPFAYSSLLFLRDISNLPDYSQKSEGVFFILFSFTCSWFTDIFAYFTGRAFGKHKLCPNISPKKTVEGAVGGVVITMLFNLLLLLVFRRYFFDVPVIPYWLIAIASVVLSVISMCGDLAASTIKRNYGIKDFGKILPGHGGIMDRFDSCLFVWPCLYAILKLISVITEMIS